LEGRNGAGNGRLKLRCQLLATDERLAHFTAGMMGAQSSLAFYFEIRSARRHNLRSLWLGSGGLWPPLKFQRRSQSDATVRTFT